MGAVKQLLTGLSEQHGYGGEIPHPLPPEIVAGYDEATACDHDGGLQEWTPFDEAIEVVIESNADEATKRRMCARLVSLRDGGTL